MVKGIIYRQWKIYYLILRSDNIKLRNYQTDIINKTRQAFKNGYKKPLVVLPCGGGKLKIERSIKLHIHILFEQSGTFKKEFNKLGYQATTYDIENQFNKTDNVIDLFKEIEKGYENEPSIFDNITQNDLILAFFPCTWFSVQNELIWSRKAYHFRTWNDEKIDEYISNRKKDRAKVYALLLKFIHIVENKGIKTIIENPYTSNYLLSQKEMKQPDLVIMNRRELGDYFIKPTMFYYYNFEPTIFSNYIQANDEKLRTVKAEQGINRSLMHKDFANNFIRKHILGT